MGKFNENLNRKYRYAVSLIADGQSSGFVELTKEQAEIVAYATTTSNWINANKEPYSGIFFIDTENPIELTSDILEFLTSNDDYKDYALIEYGESLKDLIEDEFEIKEIPVMQIKLMQPVISNTGKIIDIVGFVGHCSFKDGKIIPFDDDTYNSEMTVYGYKWFDYDDEEYGKSRGLNVLVGSDW